MPLLPLRAVLAIVPLLALPAAAHAQDASDLTVRVDQLEQRNRDLTGQIQVLQHQVEVLGDQLKREQADVGFRLDALEGHGHARPSSPPPLRRSDAGGAATPDADVPDNSARNPRAPAPGQTNLGTLATSGQDGGIVAPDEAPGPGGGAGGPLVITPNLPGAAPAAPGRSTATLGQPIQPSIAAPPTNSPDDAYALAKGFLERRNYDDAELQFKDFLSTYPRDSHVADALYGLGESYYMRRRYNDALEPFLKLVTDHASSPRAAQGMLRLGQTLAAIDQREQACATFNALPKKFPRASAAKADASREMQRDHC
ncbi:MAG TPA: tol-pal system protein YbgF [Hyphomicrobiales bacterium]|nr:tol-pal system protein YbgF [Hyphomicrobiales bacterium]